MPNLDLDDVQRQLVRDGARAEGMARSYISSLEAITVFRIHSPMRSYRA
jgi:hypothetical protein